jgi:hypothetical protein
MLKSPFRHKMLSRRRRAARREPASSVAPVFAINSDAPCVLAPLHASDPDDETPCRNEL